MDIVEMMKIKTNARCLALLIAACIPAITKAQTVTYSYAHEVNFAEFKTYEWGNMVGEADQITDKDIQEAIDLQLSSAGLSKSHSGPQILIGYQVSIGREKEIGMHEGFWSYGPGWHYGDGCYGYAHGYSFVCPASMTTETGSTIQFGDLVLDVYDLPHRDLVWRGMVSKAMSFSADSGERRQRLKKAVAKLIKAFPRKPKNQRPSILADWWAWAWS